MKLLFSNYPPLKTEYSTYHDEFVRLLEKSDKIEIASGYISADALIDLKSVVETNHKPFIELNIGMHFFDGMSKQQYDAAIQLDNLLHDLNLGAVNLVVAFPFHGKMMSFSVNSDRSFASILGSSNLTNIVENRVSRQYEADCLFEGEVSYQIQGFIKELRERGAKPLREIDLSGKIYESKNPLLEEQDGVKKVTPLDKSSMSFDFVFEIPLKADDATRSNLNTFNGKGRENTQHFVMPRSWYEVELIVPKSIATLPGYPQSDKDGDGGCINVITDDGWEFCCKVSGQNNKNLRSNDDLKILGKWLKGRLENSGSLTTGDLVSDTTLLSYGRNTFTLAKISNSDKWYLDFGVNK